MIKRLQAVGWMLFLGACASNPQQVSAPTEAQATDGLTGTRWQLVERQSMDDSVLRPRSDERITLDFRANGELGMQVDCNRVTSHWTVDPPSGLSIGLAAGTLMLCPPPSLHDRWLADLEHVRSFILRDGHLFISLQADGGIYEFKPLDADAH